jgi:hypothetical protein
MAILKRVKPVVAFERVKYFVVKVLSLRPSGRFHLPVVDDFQGFPNRHSPFFQKSILQILQLIPRSGKLVISRFRNQPQVFVQRPFTVITPD